MNHFWSTVIIIVIGLFATLSVHNSVEYASTCQKQLTACQGQLIDAKSQIERDDRIFDLVLGDWHRDLPVKSKPVTITAYTSRPEETDDTPYLTACGTKVTVGGVAVSQDLFDELGGCGASFAVIGKGRMFVNDTMNSRWKNSIDIWAGDLTAARLHGRQTATMVWQ